MIVAATHTLVRISMLTVSPALGWRNWGISPQHRRYGTITYCGYHGRDDGGVVERGQLEFKLVVTIL